MVGRGLRAVRGRTWLALWGLTAVALFGSWLVLRYDVEPDGVWVEGGPVRVPDPHGYVVRYDKGDVFTDGFERLILTGDEAGVLRRVELVGPDADHFEVVGILIAGPDRRTGSVQVYDGFSSTPQDPQVRGLGPLVPAAGAALATGKVGSVLQIGLRVVKPGLAVRSGIRVYYTVGEERYTSFQPGGVVVCPEGRTTRRCFDALYEEW